MSAPLRALLFRRTSEPSAITVHFDGEIYLVNVRRHRQARRYTLRIHAASREIVLTMPPRGSVKQAKDFAQKHGAWIRARLKRFPAAAPATRRTYYDVCALRCSDSLPRKLTAAVGRAASSGARGLTSKVTRADTVQWSQT